MAKADMKKVLKKGLFITFEGPEGCGKSTHSKILYEYLKGEGYPCVLAREPGTTRLGESIREILLDGKGIGMNDVAELFLFEAARAELVGEVVRPALEEKKLVISDRFSDASLAYQGYGGGIDLALIEKANRLATGGRIKPDLTILLDIDAERGLERATRDKTDRMELKGLEYHKRVRAGYLELARRDPSRFKVIGLKATIEETQAVVRREAEDVIQRYLGAGER